MALKDKMIARLAGLQKQRAEVVARGKAEVQALDAQIASCTDLVANWDTFTIDQAVVALAKAGVTVEVK